MFVSIATNILGWGSAGLVILCYYLLGEKVRWGFIIGVVGALSWCVYAVITKQWSILICNAAASGVCLKGYINWG